MIAHNRSGNRAALVVRLLLFLIFAVLTGACGKEAMPRAVGPTASPTGVAASVSTLSQAQHGSPSAIPVEKLSLGDPNAPIQVIEYGDYQ